jgi:hypothetical protein
VKFYRARVLLGERSNYLSLEQAVLLSPSARFRNWRWRRAFRRRGRRRYVLFDQVPNGCRKHQGDQFRAPVFQRQSGPQNGNQHCAPVLRGLSLHNCCVAKFPRCIDETSPGSNCSQFTADGKWKSGPALFEMAKRGLECFRAAPALLS